jgi:hypothetical protein
MNTALSLAVAMTLAAPLFSQPVPVQPESPLRLSTSFDLTIHASYAETAPLFGPEGERAWAGKHWDPQFIHPQPAHDEQGAVFTVRHGNLNAVWVNTLFDVEGRHFQYVYFLPDLMVTTIDVHFKVVDPQTTGVHVEYTRTALTSDGNEHVTAMIEGDKHTGTEWQQAIDAYLESHQQH